jgi:hypothetical protein
MFERLYLPVVNCITPWAGTDLPEGCICVCVCADWCTHAAFASLTAFVFLLQTERERKSVQLSGDLNPMSYTHSALAVAAHEKLQLHVVAGAVYLNPVSKIGGSCVV